jgi:hypothetical protein
MSGQSGSARHLVVSIPREKVSSAREDFRSKSSPLPDGSRRAHILRIHR